MSTNKAASGGKRGLRAYVVSDLHLYSKRSQGVAHLNVIYEAAENADVFVFNGDIFDFRWTTLHSIPETVRRSIAWLEDVANRFPECDFHFVLGNHDNEQLFIDALDRLARDTPNLSWHPFYLRLGNCIFLHGDVSERKMSPAELARSRAKWRTSRKRGQMSNLMYDAVVYARLHKAIARLMYPRKRVARRVCAYLDHIGNGVIEDLEHVYFGHTHLAMADYEYRGLLFHNNGAPLRGMDFGIIETRIAV